MAHTTSHSTQSILVLGGGYAGVLAASRIAGRLGTKAQVTLVSERTELVHRIRLHEALAGRAVAHPSLRKLLPPQVRVVQGRVEEVDAAHHTVHVRGHGALSYDVVVIALGSALSVDVPGALAHAGWLASPESAAQGAARLRLLPEGAPVTVIGGGLTAIETAAEIAEAHPRLRVTLLAPRLGPGLSEAGRSYLRATFAELGVQLREGAHAARIEAEAVELDDGTRVASAFTVWAGGFTATGPSIVTDLPRIDDGRLQIGPDLRVPGMPEVFVAGDCAAPPPGLAFLRMGCVSALPTGAHAADGVVRLLGGQEPLPFRFAFKIQCISVGRARGLVQMVDAQDRPLERVVTGRRGALVKELICRSVIGVLKVERRFAGAYWWPKAVEARTSSAAQALLPG